MNRQAPALGAFAVAALVRLGLIAYNPTPYSLDGYQRWAGRDHLLVQDWLPATQSLIWLVAHLGGDVVAARVVVSLVAAVAAGAGATLAIRLADRPSAGWWFIGLALYGPFLSWTTVLYQEGTFLAVLFVGLALGAAGRLRAADVVIGLIGLVRYEGWPYLLAWLAWRRDWRAGVALWGAAVWLAVKASGATGFHASPVDIRDWVGIVERFDLGRFAEELQLLVYNLVRSGAFTMVVVAAWGAWRHRAERFFLLLWVMQLGITAAWMAGLESALTRMLVVPALVVAPGCAATIAREAERRRWVFAVGLVSMLLIGGGGILDARKRIRSETNYWGKEVELAQAMEACTGCVWWVDPQRGLGPRDRHDGCEAVQGITSLRRDADFYCAAWETPEAAVVDFPKCDSIARYDGKTYVIEHPGRDTSGKGPPPALYQPEPPDAE